MKQINTKKVAVFALTFLAYASLHSLRQGWSLSKAQIKDIPQLHSDKQFLGIVDTCYLISYSLGMMTLGNLIHKMELKHFVGIGMILASLFYLFVPLYFQLFKDFSHAAVIVFMSLNGFFQCTGWPGIVGIMGNWFDKGKTGLILGIWAINANIGNIIAQIMCNILNNSFGAPWTYNFYSTGIFNILVGVAIIMFLKDKPENKEESKIQLKVVEKRLINNKTTQNDQPELQDSVLTSEGEMKEESEKIEQKNTGQNQKEKKSTNIFKSLCYPKVPSYVIGYAMLKGCIYGLLFWLPTYLNQKDLQSQNGYISAMVDTGSFIGGLVIGYVGDKLKFRALFLSPLLFVSSVVMFCSAYFLSNVAWEYYVAMFLVGITIGGPYNIIGAVITIDLGRATKELGGSTATISALIQGTAAVFAAGSQLLIAALSQQFTFYIFFAECIIAAIVLFPLFLTEWRLYQAQKAQIQK